MSIRQAHIVAEIGPRLSFFPAPSIWCCDTAARRSSMTVLAGVQGIVVELLVKPGILVAEGDDLLVIESMKLEYVVKCPMDGRVAELLVSAQDAVREDTVVVRLAP